LPEKGSHFQPKRLFFSPSTWLETYNSASKEVAFLLSHVHLSTYETVSHDVKDFQGQECPLVAIITLMLTLMGANVDHAVKLLPRLFHLMLTLILSSAVLLLFSHFTKKDIYSGDCFPPGYSSPSNLSSRKTKAIPEGKEKF
jgi:hypothetical protein